MPYSQNFANKYGDSNNIKTGTLQQTCRIIYSTLKNKIKKPAIHAGFFSN